MKTLWIKNGRVIDPANARDAVGDVYAVDGKLVDSLSDEQKQNAEVIDATGLVVSPGLVDIHVHLREPGQTHKEDIGTGSHAAAAGGFTSIVCMPNTSPAADDRGTIQQINDSIAQKAVVRVYPTGCITKGRKGEALTNVGSLKKAGVVAITDDGDCVQNNEIMRRAVEYARMFDLCVMDHCQDESLTQGSVMNEGTWSLKLGLRGWPNAAEDIIVARNVILAEYTGGHIHMQHISSARSVEILKLAKSRGVSVTSEVSPHHIHLTDACLAEYDTNFKMNPPLRTEADRQALIEGLKDGVITCICTDHAPHTADEKDQEFDYAPFGITGLETSLAVSLEVMHYEHECSLSQVVAWLTHKPAEVLKLEAGTLSAGANADIAIFNPEEKWEVTKQGFKSKSINSPWVGCSLRGKVHRTIVGGKTVYCDGEVITG